MGQSKVNKAKFSLCAWFFCIARDTSPAELACLAKLTENPVRSVELPKLRVLSSEELIEYDEEFNALESVTYRIYAKINSFIPIFQTSCEKLVSGLKVKEIDCLDLLLNFYWDSEKFNPRTPITELRNNLSESVQQLSNELEVLQTRFNTSKTDYDNFLHQDSCSLSEKIPNLVASDSHIITSKFMTTIYVIVPKSQKDIFLKVCDSEAHQIVPKSLLLLKEDRMHLTYTIVLFKAKLAEYQEFLNSIKCSATEIFHGFESEKDFWSNRIEAKERFSTNANVLKLWLEISCREIFQILLHIKTVILHIKTTLMFGQPLKQKHFNMIIFDANKVSSSVVHNKLSNIAASVLEFENSSAALPNKSKNSFDKNHSEEYQLPFSMQKILC